MSVSGQVFDYVWICVSGQVFDCEVSVSGQVLDCVCECKWSGV